MPKRPLCLFCGSFLTVLFACSYFYGVVKPLCALLLTVISLTFAIIYLKVRQKGRKCLFLSIISIISAAASLGMFVSYGSIDIDYKATADRYSGEGRVCELLVTRVTVDGVYGSYETTVYSVDGESVELRAKLQTSYNAYLDVGDRVSIRGDITGARGGVSLGDSYYLSKGFVLSITSNEDCQDELVLLKTDDLSDFNAVTGLLSKKIWLRLLSVLDEKSAGIMRALICADKSTLDDDIHTNFKLLGLSHMLAVSGMHLGIIAGLIAILLRAFPIGRKTRSILTLALSLVYVAICSFTPSACRSFGMLLVLFLEPFSRRPRDIASSLLFAVAVICLVSPYSIIDIGLLASFSATFGVLVIGAPITDKLKRKNRLIRALLEPMILTYAATVFMIPLSVCCFGGMSLISPLSNVIFLPLLTLIMYMAPILLLSTFSPISLPIFAYVTELLCRVVSWLADKCALEIFYIDLKYPMIKWLVIPYITLAILFSLKRKTRMKALPILLAVFVVTASVNDYCVRAMARMIDRCITVSDRTNDAILIIDGGSAMLVDNSNGGGNFWYTCIEAAGESGVAIDTLVLTHPHVYQGGGISRFFEDGHLKRVVIVTDENADYYNLPERCENNNVELVLMNSGELLSYGDFEVTVDVEKIERSSHICVAVAIEHSEYSAVYLGASAWESDTLKSFALSRGADELFVGFHGPNAVGEPSKDLNAYYLEVGAQMIFYCQ